MKEQTIVHIKVDYEDALQSKKDILSSEGDFLKIIKRIKRYEILRKEELGNRIRIQNKLKELNNNLNKMNQVFPKIKLPDLLKKKEAYKKVEEEKEKIIKEKEKEVDTHEDELEVQLREIQEKLKKLG